MLQHSLFKNLPYPKEKDLTWRKYNLDNKKWESSSMPPYKTDFSQTINKDTILNLLKEKKNSNETITK